MSKNNPFGVTETAALFLSISLEVAMRRALRKAMERIDGLTDEEIKPLIVEQEERKKRLMGQVHSH